MVEAERRLRAEIAGLMEEAEAVDTAEDAERGGASGRRDAGGVEAARGPAGGDPGGEGPSGGRAAGEGRWRSTSSGCTPSRRHDEAIVHPQARAPELPKPSATPIRIPLAP